MLFIVQLAIGQSTYFISLSDRIQKQELSREFIYDLALANRKIILLNLSHPWLVVVLVTNKALSLSIKKSLKNQMKKLKKINK